MASKHTCANRSFNPDSPLHSSTPCFPPQACKWKLGTRRGWPEEIKTCLITTATNDVAAFHTLCPLIGLFHSLHLNTHVIPTTQPRHPSPKPKQANPKTRLRGWGGMEELRHGRSEGCSSGEEKRAPEADVGVRRSPCVLINKALKKKGEHIKAYRGYAIIHESNALWLNVS